MVQLIIAGIIRTAVAHIHAHIAHDGRQLNLVVHVIDRHHHNGVAAPSKGTAVVIAGIHAEQRNIRNARFRFCFFGNTEFRLVFRDGRRLQVAQKHRGSVDHHAAHQHQNNADEAQKDLKARPFFLFLIFLIRLL